MMTSRHVHLSVFALFVLCFVVAVTACSKKDVKSEDDAFIAEDTMEESGSADLGDEVGTSSFDSSDTAPTTISAGELQTVYFDYDQYNLRGDTRAALQSNADWLKANPGATVEIQGHCDERGTEEYNMALGERRANSARNYLEGLGVDRSRLDIVSYGEESPAVLGTTDSAWGQNRRAEFRITSQ